MKPGGFVFDQITPEHWVFGANSKIKNTVLVEDRNWKRYVPETERQYRNDVETWSCVSFALLNCLEALTKRKYGRSSNYADRYLAQLAGTIERVGNSPQNVAETMRRVGVIPEDDLPFSSSIKTFDEYHSGVTWSHKLTGARWLLENELTHEWVYDGYTTREEQRERIYDALQFSPVPVGVTRWEKDNNFYVPAGPSIHYATVVNAKKNEYFDVLDSYHPFIKRLTWDYDFSQPKRLDITKRDNFSIKNALRIAQGLTY